MILKYYLIITTLFIFSCKEKCKNNIVKFNFPNDIELLSSKKQICNNSVNKWVGILDLEYDDANFSQFNYGEKNKILIDKRNNMILCFKTNEVDNFKIIFNQNDSFTYGIDNIYLLNNDLLPLYSFGELGVLKYFNNKKLKQTSTVEIINYNIKPLIELKYDEIISIFTSLSSNNYKRSEIQKVIPYYKNPYSWEL